MLMAMLLIVSMHLHEVVVLEARVEFLDEVVDRDDGLIGQIGEGERFGWIVHVGFLNSWADQALLVARRVAGVSVRAKTCR